MSVQKNRRIRTGLAILICGSWLASLSGCERELFTQKDDVANQRSLYWGEQHSVWENAHEQSRQDSTPLPIGAAVSGY